MLSTISDVSLYICCPDDLSIGENGALKLPTITGLMLVCVFKSKSRLFIFLNEIG